MKSKTRSVCIVMDGSCKCIYQKDKFHPDTGKSLEFDVLDIRPGSHFGTSDLLGISDIEYMGDIYAGSQGARILVIPKPDTIIQVYERNILTEKLRDNLDTLKFMLENKYAIENNALLQY